LAPGGGIAQAGAWNAQPYARPYAASGWNEKAARSSFEDHGAAGPLTGIRPRPPGAAIKVSAMVPDFAEGVADWPQTLRPYLAMDGNLLNSRKWLTS
jgi:hypothetical protein